MDVDLSTVPWDKLIAFAKETKWPTVAFWLIIGIRFAGVPAIRAWRCRQ